MKKTKGKAHKKNLNPASINGSTDSSPNLITEKFIPHTNVIVIAMIKSFIFMITLL